MGRGIFASSVIVACVVATPPMAEARGYETLTFVKWGGSPCIWVMSPTQGNYWSTSIDYVCDQNNDQQIVFRTTALSGQYVGADPVISGSVTWAGCSVVVNGLLEHADYADAGDGTDVTCLRVLN